MEPLKILSAPLHTCVAPLKTCVAPLNTCVAPLQTWGSSTADCHLSRLAPPWPSWGAGFSGALEDQLKIHQEHREHLDLLFSCLCVLTHGTWSPLFCSFGWKDIRLLVTSCHFCRQLAGITFFHPRLSAAFAEGQAAFPKPGKDNTELKVEIPNWW